MRLLTLLFVLLLATKANANLLPFNSNKTFSAKNNTGITEKQFNSAVDRIYDFYKGEVSYRGSKLVIEKMWEDPTPNSVTTQENGTWLVYAYGGLARHPHMTPDGYLMVLCHEIGHHLAGFPKVRNNHYVAWASNEGQSDYFAALKCFKAITIDDDNRFFADCSKDYMSECCQKPSRQEEGACGRAIEAGISLANVLHDLAGEAEPFDISIYSYDKTQVKQTYDGHPNSQCRLDTYYAGAVCDANPFSSFSETGPIKGACAQEAGFILGIRPECWYASQKRSH